MPAQHSILVVDDEAEIIKSLRSLLRLDYNIIGATRAAEGMEILKREQVQAVMTDQRMPEMTGVELLRRVHEQYPDVTRLLFTGYADVKAVVDAINKGHVYRYITKPWDPTELQTILRDACAHHDLIAERKQLMEELQKKNVELRQANELKTAFIRVASHEFRTPVTILGGLCQLARLENGDADAGSDYLGQIDAAVSRLQRLVNDTLSMLSTERFDAVFNRRAEDMARIINLAADDIRPFIELRRQHLSMELAADLGSLNIDAEKVRDSLNHLLLNAIKFSPDLESISLRAHRHAEGVLIEISDTGCGIADESLPRMFEPFFTGFDVSRHSSGLYEHGAHGLGLGLSVVRAFIQMHGGRVSVESEIGKGSKFSIFLPENPEASTLVGTGSGTADT